MSTTQMSTMAGANMTKPRTLKLPPIDGDNAISTFV
jgi:hypothetical protein